MPKLTNRPPQYKQCGKYAVVYVNGRRIFLGLYGSAESQKEYARIIAESKSNPTFSLHGAKNITLDEVAVAYLDHAEQRFGTSHYENYRTALKFATDLYGHQPVDEFSPLKLKTVRDEMVRTKGGDWCRNTINRNVDRIRTVLTWGTENELVESRTSQTLRAVKTLPKGTPGTFDHKKRRPVSIDAIRRTLLYLPQVLRAMVVIQWLTGCRPSEIFNMIVGEIDRNYAPGLWCYTPAHHKTEQYTEEDKLIPLGKPEQELLAPYLEGKTADQAVFSPGQAVRERASEKRANRKSKRTPSQKARDDTRAAKPQTYADFYDKNSYNRAVTYAIRKANRHLREGEKPVPHWFPYQLRHSAGTETSRTQGKEKAQHLLTHASIETTEIYDDSALEVREELARNRQNPFDTKSNDGLVNNGAAE
jgi:integrase